MSNVNFTKVGSLAGQFSNLNVSDASVSGSLEANEVTLNNSGYVRRTVVGYAPTSFATSAASGTVHNLLNGPGLTAATVATDSRLVSLPPLAVATNVVFDNNGTTVASAGAPVFDITVAAFGNTGPNLVAAAALATVNTPGGNNPQYDVVTAGNPNIPVAAAPANLLSVEVDGLSGVTLTAGDFRCWVEYFEHLT